MSYGQQKLLTLTCCLATEARILLLDEPVSGVHPEMVEKILGLLRELKAMGKLANQFPPNPDSPGDAAAQHDHYLYGTPKKA